MDRKIKIDFLTRLREGRTVVEELEPINILVTMESGYRNWKTGKYYSEDEVQRFKDLNVCFVIIDEQDAQL